MVYTVCRAPQRQFAQGHEVALAKEVLHGAVGLLRHVDFAGLEARQQFVGRQVNQYQFVGSVEHAVGHGLPHAGSGDAAHHIVQALDVLHIHRGVHVDTRDEQLLYVLAALGVAAAHRVAVCQFVNQNELRLALQGGVKVKFAQRAATVVDLAQRQLLQPFEQAGGFFAAVCLDQAHHHIHALRLLLARRLQHGVGFAHAGACAKKDLELAALRLAVFRFHLRQQGIGVRAVVVGGHGESLASSCAKAIRVRHKTCCCA